MKNKELSKGRKTLKTIKNIVCWGLVAILAISVIAIITTKVNGGTPSLFGYSIYRVSSGSMEPELVVGDVILSKEVDDVNTLKVGNVITYLGEEGDLKGKHITHKIIVAPHKDENGQVVLQTQGVANEIADKEITAEQVETIYICKIGILDTIYNLFLSPWGLIIFILLILLIFFDEIVNLVKILTGHSDEEQEDINEIIERIQREEKEKLIAQVKKEAEEKAKTKVDAEKTEDNN